MEVDDAGNDEAHSSDDIGSESDSTDYDQDVDMYDSPGDDIVGEELVASGSEMDISSDDGEGRGGCDGDYEMSNNSGSVISFGGYAALTGGGAAAREELSDPLATRTDTISIPFSYEVRQSETSGKGKGQECLKRVQVGGGEVEVDVTLSVERVKAPVSFGSGHRRPVRPVWFPIPEGRLVSAKHRSDNSTISLKPMLDSLTSYLTSDGDDSETQKSENMDLFLDWFRKSILTQLRKTDEAIEDVLKQDDDLEVFEVSEDVHVEFIDQGEEYSAPGQVEFSARMRPAN